MSFYFFFVSKMYPTSEKEYIHNLFVCIALNRIKASLIASVYIICQITKEFGFYKSWIGTFKCYIYKQLLSVQKY